MNELVLLEGGIIDRVSQVEYGGAPAFAVVRGYGIGRDEKLPPPLPGERMPAAYVCFRSGFYDFELFTLARYFYVFVATRSLRKQDDARLPGEGRPGLLHLLGLVNAALDTQIVFGQTRVFLSGAQIVTADAQTLIGRLSYVSYGGTLLSDVTLDGEPLLPAGSFAEVVVGDAESREMAYALPGAAGLLRQPLAPGARTVALRGLLRAESDAALGEIEAGLEARVADPAPRTLVDASGRVLPECVVRAYRRRGPRATGGGELPVRQSFTLELIQLSF